MGCPDFSKWKTLNFFWYPRSLQIDGKHQNFFLKKTWTCPRNQLKFNEFRYDCIYFARIFKKLFTFSTPKKRMPYALNEANFKKLFTFFVVLKSWKTQITNAVQSKNFYFLLASIQIRRASILLRSSAKRGGGYVAAIGWMRILPPKTVSRHSPNSRCSRTDWGWVRTQPTKRHWNTLEHATN